MNLCKFCGEKVENDNLLLIHFLEHLDEPKVAELKEKIDKILKETYEKVEE